MKIINADNGADKIFFKYAQIVTDRFQKDLTGVLMGIAYGGEVEKLADMWRGKGFVYGYDTFEDMHPKYLVEPEYPNEAECMDLWYIQEGVEKLKYSYQRGYLDGKGLTNAFLIKGLVNKDSCKNIDKIHIALLDMDIYHSMRTGFEAVKDKIVVGGYLHIHDVPNNYLKRLQKWYDDVVLKDKSFKMVEQSEGSYTTILEKIVDTN